MVAASTYDTPAFHGYGYQVLKFGSPIVGIGRPSIGQIQRSIFRKRKQMSRVRRNMGSGKTGIFGLRTKQRSLKRLARLNGRLRFWKRTLKAYRRYGKKRGWLIAKRNYKRWGRPRLPHRPRR